MKQKTVQEAIAVGINLAKSGRLRGDLGEIRDALDNFFNSFDETCGCGAELSAWDWLNGARLCEGCSHAEAARGASSARTSVRVAAPRAQ